MTGNICDKCGKRMRADFSDVTNGSMYIKPVLKYRCSHCDGNDDIEKLPEELKKIVKEVYPDVGKRY